MKKIVYSLLLIFFFGCGTNNIITYELDCTNLKKASVSYYSGMGTSVDPNQFGYIWAENKNKILFIRNEDLKKNLWQLFPRVKVLITDGNYALVDDFWFYEVFVPSIKKKFPTYCKSFDCDKFSEGVSFYAHWLHNYTKLNECDGIAIGELFYEVDREDQAGHTGHAINIILSKKDGKYYYSFFDMNCGKKIILSKKEILSTYFIRF